LHIRVDCISITVSSSSSALLKEEFANFRLPYFLNQIPVKIFYSSDFLASAEASTAMKTIVILGTGVAATAVIRQTMKSTVLKRNDIKMVVVSPSTHFLWPIAMPRAIVPGQFAGEKFMFPLETTFNEYPADKFEFVLGTASSLDPKTKQITVSVGKDSNRRVIQYDTVVIATGASAKNDMPWKPMDTTQHTIDRLHKIQEEIKQAKTIVVAGGGATGAETAGELGYEYSRNGTKEVYFIHKEVLPLSPPAIESVRKQVKTDLEKLKVKILASTTITNVATSGKDTILELRHADGTTKTLTTQAYIPTMGLTPNTTFIPQDMLNSRGFVKQTTHLRAKDHSDVFVIGDAGSLEGSTAAAADAQGRHLIQALPLYLDGKSIPEYKVATKDMMGITLGRSRGTGQVGTMKLFSFLIWYFKGRFLGTDYAGQLAAGKRTLSTKLE
jgi:NADH dehydrogenase FAD-containing subunit